VCGFIGYTSLLNQDIKLHQDKFDNYHGKMFHRGPDFQKKIEISNQSRKFNLGFSRLSIQDSSINANRIFYNQNFILLFNGELYNKSFLVKKYFNKKVFKTSTDTEVLFELLVNFGISKIHEIEGIFAFVFIDIKKNILYLTRDYTGTKPLYYSIINGEIFFSSEAWFLYSINKKNLDFDSLNFYLKFGFTPEKKTLIKNVFKAKPNNTIIYNLNNQTKTDSSIIEDLFFSKEKELSEIHPCTLNIKVRKNIEKNLVGSKKIGTFLSGGIDSSIISLETKKINPDIEAYTSIYKDYTDKDEDYQTTLKLCKEYNIKLNIHEIDLKLTGFHEFIEGANFLDEPIANLNFYSSFLQSKMAKQSGASVILTGDGSDELFGGYRKYLTYNIYDKYKNISFINSKLRQYSKLKKKDLPYFFLRKLENNNLKKILNNKILPHVLNSNEHLIENEKTLSNLAHVNFFDLQNWLCNEHNAKLDKCTMANSVEARVPFQDIDLLKHYNCNKINKKINYFKNKIQLRKAFFDLPNYVLNRKKSGWFLPEKKIIDDFLNSGIEHVFTNDANNLFNKDLIINSIKKNKFEIFSKYQIITLLMLQIWYNKVLQS
jgi:asparagine synthase (glutamine-hydrolysing)